MQCGDMTASSTLPDGTWLHLGYAEERCVEPNRFSVHTKDDQATPYNVIRVPREFSSHKYVIDHESHTLIAFI